MSNLSPYQVGDNDIVLANSPEEAISIMEEYCGGEYVEGRVNVEDLSNRLDIIFCDEEGTEIDTLGAFIEKLDEPQYLMGWE